LQIRFKFLIALALCSLVGCSSSEELRGPVTPAPTGAIKGFGLSPVGFPRDYSKTVEFYAELKTIPNSGVMWNGAWRDDVAGGTDAGQIPVAAAATVQGAGAAGVPPIIVFGWRSGGFLFLNVPANATNNWSNEESKELFLQMLVDFVTTYFPPLLFLGNENDFYFEQNPIDYANWIAFYDAAYDTIKVVAPSTEVGPVFNYEHLAGAGAMNGWTTPRWGALTAHDFSKIDVVGVTVYPFLQYSSPTSVPADYLNPLIARIGLKPIAITETGWPAEDPLNLSPPWEVSDTSQVAYVPRLQAATQGKLLRSVNWLFLNGMVSPGGTPLDWQLFGSISIRDTLGNKRLVYDDWVAFQP
jgi:hypothetical protein